MARVKQKAAKTIQKTGANKPRAAKKPVAKKPPTARKPAARKPPDKTPRANKPSAKKPPTASALHSPAPTGAYPYLHVGHGVSAARKSWGLVAILREPLEAPLGRLCVAPPLDTIEEVVGDPAIVMLHDSDSLQWVVAATYPEPGPRADRGEATAAQWQAFNDDVDQTLARLHARQPIAAVIRPVDDEYGTDLSAWHTWSMHALPRYLPFLDASGHAARWYVEHACVLWRGWLADQSLSDQTRVLAKLSAGARRVLDALGGVPKPEEAAPPPVAPTLDEMKAAWAAIPPEDDVFVAFAAAFADRATAYDLFALQHALLAQPVAEHARLVELLCRALASPSCKWPDTHWRPHLVAARVRAGELDAARAEAARVVLGANSYNSTSWETLVGLCDALGHGEDGDAIHRMADHYVTGYGLARRPPKLDAKQQRARASRVLLELSAPARAALDTLDDEALSHAAFLFEQLCEAKLGDAALAAEAARMRAAYDERIARRLADGDERLARGEPLDEPVLLDLLKHAQRTAATISAADAARLTRAACSHPRLIDSVARLAYYAKDKNPDAALAAHVALLETAPPADGQARTAWLQSANNALILSHAAKRFADSARLADQVVQHARENPYITHAAACSYVAVGRLDDAFAQAKLAVELGYDHLDRMKVDPDLGPLLERDDWEALFQNPDA